MRNVCDRLIAFVLALGLLAGALSAAHAGPYEDALAGFTEGSLSDTGDAISGVVASGNPLAAQVLTALQDARLMFSAEKKQVFIKTKAGRLLDAATGAVLAGTPPDDIDTVIVNNRLRNVIDAAMGGLTLMAPEPNKRFDAAQAVFKSHEASALPALDAALAKETDPRIKRALAQARAAVVVTTPDSTPEQKIAAIGILRDRGDQDAVGLLDSRPGNLPPNLSSRPPSIPRRLFVLFRKKPVGLINSSTSRGSAMASDSASG